MVTAENYRLDIFHTSKWNLSWYLRVKGKFVFYKLLVLCSSNGFLYDFISISHHCGGIVVHSSLQRWLQRRRFVSIFLITDINLRSVISLGHCNILMLLFFCHSVVDMLLCLGSLFYCTTQSSQKWVLPCSFRAKRLSPDSSSKQDKLIYSSSNGTVVTFKI